MAKTNEQILKDFIKANKERKNLLAQREGFETPEQYKEYLVALVTGKVVAPKETKKVEEKEVGEETDIVVAFDTTGSMASYIGAVRKHVQKLIGDLFKNTPNLRMKIVAFGDYCDMSSAKVFGKAYQETKLTDNQNDLVKFVKDAQNTSGGDGDEFYELVIKKITEETPWRGGKKSVLLIGDAEPHGTNYSYRSIVQRAGIDWKEEANKAATKGIQFDTLRIYPTSTWYAELSKLTNGVCVDFKSADKISEIIEGTTYARSSKTMFMSKMAAATASGDEELIGAYKTMSTLL